MKKPIIAIDIDDVLSAQNEAVLRFANEFYDLNLTLEDYNIEAPYWGYWETVWGVDKEEGKKRLKEFHEWNGTMKQGLVTGALEVILELEKRFTLVVVTARKDVFSEITHQWLAKHFPKVFKEVKFVPVWDTEKQVTKAAICKEIGAGYLIDDNAEHCILAHDAGITALLFGDYGWNRKEILSPGVIRVKDWKGVEEYFNEKG